MRQDHELRQRPAVETIEHRWDILYRDYPEIYDEFASFPYQPRPVDAVHERFDLTGKRVADLGAGTGRSTFAVAEHAGHVVGIEPEDAMLVLARQAAARRGVRNVEFATGSNEVIPLPNGSVDVVTSFTAGLDISEALRIVKAGGIVVSLDVAPGWYGGDLNAVLQHPTKDAEHSEALIRAGFSFMDFDAVQEYGTLDNIIRTYGFIFGRKAIDHLRRTRRTSIRWRFRIHYMRKEAATVRR